jgi:hypothetical protein
MYYFDGLEQDVYVLILECFEPGINMSILTDVAFTTNVSIDNDFVHMMQRYYILRSGQGMQVTGKLAYRHS